MLARADAAAALRVYLASASATRLVPLGARSSGSIVTTPSDRLALPWMTAFIQSGQLDGGWATGRSRSEAVVAGNSPTGWLWPASAAFYRQCPKSNNGRTAAIDVARTQSALNNSVLNRRRVYGNRQRRAVQR